MPNPKWSSLFVKKALQLTQTGRISFTWWQEFKKGSLLLPWDFARKTKEGTIHNSTSFSSEIPLRQLKARSYWPVIKLRLTALLPISITTSRKSLHCPNPLNVKAQIWREVKEVSTVWRSIPHESETPQSIQRRRQCKLHPFSHSWWCPPDVQKLHQPQQREFERKPGCIM